MFYFLILQHCAKNIISALTHTCIQVTSTITGTSLWPLTTVLIIGDLGGLGHLPEFVDQYLDYGKGNFNQT